MITLYWMAFAFGLVASTFSLYKIWCVKQFRGFCVSRTNSAFQIYKYNKQAANWERVRDGKRERERLKKAHHTLICQKRIQWWACVEHAVATLSMHCHDWFARYMSLSVDQKKKKIFTHNCDVCVCVCLFLFLFYLSSSFSFNFRFVGLTWFQLYCLLVEIDATKSSTFYFMIFHANQLNRTFENVSQLWIGHGDFARWTNFQMAWKLITLLITKCVSFNKK